MTRRTEDAAALVAGALSRLGPDQRGRFLSELLAHTAAGMVVLQGESAAAEAVYRLGDAVVARSCRG